MSETAVGVNAVPPSDKGEANRSVHFDEIAADDDREHEETDPTPPVVAQAADEFRRSVRTGSLRSFCTDREMKFLESLAEDGDERDMALAQERLGNRGVFFEEEDGEGAKEDDGAEGQKDGGSKKKRACVSLSRSTVKREKYLSERQRIQLHDSLWKTHDEKVASAAKSRWRRGVRRIVALKGLGLAKFPPLPPRPADASKEDRGEVKAEEKKEEEDREREKRRSGLFDRSGLMVRMASVYRYGHLSKGQEDLGEGFEVGDEELMIWGSQGHEDHEDDEPAEAEAATKKQPNAWDVLKQSPADSGLDASGSSHHEPPPFLILGTSADDEACHPHVLSPPLMEALRSSFPFALSEDNFWIKYSLVRDGSSLISLLKNSRASKHTVIAVETVDGEVFGSFTSMPWRKQHGFFGNGQSFLWRMREPRTNTSCSSVDDQAELESNVEVFKWTGADDVVQICSGGHIAVGGGGDVSDVESAGFGFMIEDDLLRGSSGSCETFGNPCLCPRSIEGGVFEIANLEVWTTTPFMFAEDAEKNEMMKMFLEENKVN